MNAVFVMGKNRDETAIVFTTLLRGILRRAAIRDHERLARLRRYLINSLDDARLSASANARVRHWTHHLQISSCDDSELNLKPDEMTEVLNLLYMSICAEMGPVAADRIFSDAAKETDALPQADRFPARSLFRDFV